MPPKKKVITLTQKDFTKEHKNLVNLLDTTSKKLQKEANEQRSELKQKTKQKKNHKKKA